MNGSSDEFDLDTCATLQREEWEVLEVCSFESSILKTMQPYGIPYSPSTQIACLATP